jgi:BASS family bile acid:Na+ symporter
MVEQTHPESRLDRNDALLFMAIAGSIAAGIFLPSAGSILEPYLLVWLGGLLFLNLIKLDPADLASTFKAPKKLIFLSAVKLVALPLFFYAVTRVVYAPLAVPVLLLSGISTGLGAPFVINITQDGKKKQLSLVVAMVIATSLAVPFVLPSLVYFAVGKSHFEIPILQMIFVLVTALFAPMAAGWFVRKRWPAAAKKIDDKSFPASAIFIALMNFGLFAQISGFFFREPRFLLVEIAAVFILFAAYSAAGYLAGVAIGRKKKEFVATGVVTMTYVNNVLVFVFASQFFSPNDAALAAFYNLPYYGLILLLKKSVNT